MPDRRLLTISPFTGSLIGLVLTKVDDKEVERISTQDEADAFLKAEFPSMYPIIPSSEIAAFPNKSVGKLPQFHYVGPDLHCGRTIVLLGDTVHTVKPYFGLGLNSALRDVGALKDALTANMVRLTAPALRTSCSSHLSQPSRHGGSRNKMHVAYIHAWTMHGPLTQACKWVHARLLCCDDV